MIAALALVALVAGPTAAPGGPPSVKWGHDFERALDKARSSGKPVIVDFWADWCGWCHRLDDSTYVDPLVVELSRQFVAVKVDTEGGPEQQEVAARYDVSSLPTIAFLSPSGRQLLRVGGFQGPGQFPRTMRIALEVAQRVMAWEAKLDCEPDDPEALIRLGTHMFDQEFYEQSRELLARARGVDGARSLAERKQVRLMLGVVQYYDRRYAEAEKLLREALALGAEDEHDAKILYVLGRNYYRWGQNARARVTLEDLLERYPGNPIAQKARETLVVLEASARQRR